MNNKFNYNDYKEEGEVKMTSDYLDRVMEYCNKKGITYAEFQRREYFGKIPLTVLTKLKDNLAIKKEA